jgi:hypothetical protein
MNMKGKQIRDFNQNICFILNRISDQCSKPIKSKYYLFELVGKYQNDLEIFGANNVNERDVR